jgi:hypothetical protein
MFGTILVSMIGITLPVLAGVWLTPRIESPAFVSATRSAAGSWVLFQHARDSLGSLATGRGRLRESGAASSSIRYG